MTAVTINLFIRNSLTYYPSEKITRRLIANSRDNTEDLDINTILDTGFFPDSSVESGSTLPGSGEAEAVITDLKLMGTITGSKSVTMAMIMKRGDKQPSIYKLWANVGGFTITGIQSNQVSLKKNNETFVLNLYEKKQSPSDKSSDSSSQDVPGGIIKNVASRAEIQQKVMNDLDKAMEGIKGGPYKINDKIEGFRIIRIQPTNILFEYGMRNGDIIKRVNGKKVDSTEKLLNMWQGFKSESKLVIDVERNGQMITFDITITD